MVVYVVITTCLRDELSCNCLLDCIDYARRFYKHILIIDDTPVDGINIYQLRLPPNVKIIKNEFNKSGEITRIWYFWKYARSGDYGILIHDSTFLNTELPILKYDFVPLFSFKHDWDDTDHEREFLENYPELLQRYSNKKSWYGSFGVQYELSWDFVDRVMEEYQGFFEELLEKVKTRGLRSCMERVIQVLFVTVSDNTIESMYGTIQNYTRHYWGTLWGVDYEVFKKKHKAIDPSIPIIKVWVGR